MVFRYNRNAMKIAGEVNDVPMNPLGGASVD